MRALWQMVRFLLRTSRGRLSSRGLVVLALIAAAVSGLASAGLLVQINRALSHPEQIGLTLVWTFLGFCLLLPASRFLSQVLLVRLAQTVLSDLRLHLTRQILATPLRRLEEIGPHRILTVLTDDTATIREILSALPLVLMHLTVVVASLLYLAWISRELLLVVLFVLVFGAATYRLGMSRAMPFLRRARQGAEHLLKLFRGLTEGTKELKIHAPRRRSFLDGVLRATRSIQDANVTGGTIQAAANSWGQILSFVLVALLFLLFATGRGVDVEVLTGSVLVILYMRTPMDVIMQMIPNLNRATVAMERVSELGLLLDESAGESDAVQDGRGRPWHDLELAGVTHAYRREGEETDFVLGPIDLRFAPRELVLVVGGNGSGKTTLAKLILGLYTPDGGEIRLDGRAVTEETREGYRQHFSAVFSDFYLFETLLGLEARDGLDEQARAFLDRLHLAGKVEVRDGTLSTTQLSQGQRKRLALLTSFLEDRAIYLFDEWAADQDPYFKSIFYLEFLPQLKANNKTVIVITHDDRYFHVADRIIKLEQGRVVYDGPAPKAPLAGLTPLAQAPGADPSLAGELGRAPDPLAPSLQF